MRKNPSTNDKGQSMIAAAGKQVEKAIKSSKYRKNYNQEAKY